MDATDGRSDAALLERVLESTTNAIYVRDAAGVFTLVNPALCRITGYAAEELVGRRFSDLLLLYDDAARAAAEASFQRVQRGETSAGLVLSIRRKDGAHRRVRLNAAPLRDAQGRVIGAVGAAEDITEVEQQAERLQLMEMAVMNADDAIVITDAELDPPGPVIEFVNPAFTRKTGWRPEEVLGKTPRILQGPKTDRTVLDRLKRTLRAGGVFHGEAVNYRKNGEEFLLEWHVAPVRDAQGRVTHYVSVQRDVTERQRMRRLVAYQSEHDMLTGALNRGAFDARVQALLDRGAQGWGLLYVDLGRFNLINEHCGHQAGDDLLRLVAQRLADGLHGEELLARLGGDVFGIAVRTDGAEALVAAGRRVLDTLAGIPYECRAQRFPLGASVGAVPLARDQGATAGALLRASEHACHLAKLRGRNRVELYSAKDARIARRRREMAWVSHIEGALAGDRFFLLRQHIECNPRGGQSGPLGRHSEVLLRMEAEDGSWIEPDEFIPAAERYHLMPRVDRWVVRQVARRIAVGREVPADARYFINVSGTTLGDETFCQDVRRVFAQYGVEPRRVGFEITETAAISDLPRAVNFIEQMRRLGSAIALDDFGTGLSSFGYLKSLSVDYLKIDGTFVRRLAADAVDHVMVEAINRVGHVMGLRTVAECVSDRQVREELQRIGVDCFQGYAIHRPERWPAPEQ